MIYNLFLPRPPKACHSCVLPNADQYWLWAVNDTQLRQEVINALSFRLLHALKPNAHHTLQPIAHAWVNLHKLNLGTYDGRPVADCLVRMTSAGPDRTRKIINLECGIVQRSAELGNTISQQQTPPTSMHNSRAGQEIYHPPPIFSQHSTMQIQLLYVWNAIRKYRQAQLVTLHMINGLVSDSFVAINLWK